MEASSSKEMMYFSPYYYLGIDAFIVFLQMCSIFGNGFIIYLFYRTRLRKNLALRLVLTLAVTDFLFGVTTIPYMAHYLAYWNTIEFNYNGLVVITLSLPLTIQFKVNLMITTAIAVDRLQAMRFPMHFRKKSHMRYALVSLGIGLGLGLIDVFFQYYLSPLKSNPGCAAVGCFTSWEFRIYWGFGNMVLNVIMLMLTVVVAYDINKLRRKHNQQISPQEAKSAGKKVSSEDKNISQANRLSMGILGISILFLMVPSTFVGAVDWFGLQTFERLGPFYIFGLLLAGVSNSFIYIIFHVELRMAAKKAIQGYGLYWKSAAFNMNTNSTSFVNDNVLSNIERTVLRKGCSTDTRQSPNDLEQRKHVYL